MMTREEAIEILEGSKRQNEVMRDNPSTFWAPHQMAGGIKNAEKRIAALDLAISALRGPTREMVEKAWKGEWILHENKDDVFSSYHTCSRCGSKFGEASHIDVFHLDFCPVCHAAMTDEAVEMVMERLEALKGD